MPRLRVGSKVASRLLHPFGDAASKLTSSVSGCLYGFVPDADNEHYTLIAATGSQKSEEERLNEEDGQRKDDMEVLHEILPCGVDPVGVFLLETEADRGRRDLNEVHRLLSALPDALMETADPVVMFLAGEGDDARLEAFVAQEGELVAADMEDVDSLQLVREEAVTVRVKGTVNLTSGQNENDLNMAFKHLIEKVRS